MEHRVKLSRTKRSSLILAATIILGGIAFATNPELTEHFEAMRRYAEIRAPYSITHEQLVSSEFHHRNFILWSVAQRKGKTCTIGCLGGVYPTVQLQPALVEVYFSSRGTTPASNP
jgi:hypothetical protein